MNSLPGKVLHHVIFTDPFGSVGGIYDSTRATLISTGAFRMLTPAAGIHHLTAVGSASTVPASGDDAFNFKNVFQWGVLHPSQVGGKW